MSDERSITARFTADTSGFSPKVNELIQHLKSLNSAYAANEQEIKRLNTEMKSYQKELQALEQKQRSEQGLTESETAQMQSLRDSIARCATELGTYRSAQSTLRSDINQTSRELNEQRDAMNGVSHAAASFGDVLKANIISDAIHTGLQKTLELLKSAAAYCYDVGTSFESAMSQVEAISGATGSQLEALTNKAKELGSSTKFTATQAAEAMNYMAMAGWDAEQMLSGIDGVLSLAAASGEDLGTTSDIVTDALTAFGLKAEDVGHFSDVLAAAAANANTNVALMGETFKYCAADAGSFGFTAEDTVTAIGLMASAGIKGSQAGTALRRLFNEMSGDLKITSKEFGEIAIKTANADGTMRPFIDIIRDLRTEFSKLKPQEMSAVAEQLVGKNAQTGFKTLMNASEEDFKKLTEAIENCDGAAANMAKTMQDNLAGKVTILESALEGLGNSVYEKFAPALKETVEIFTDCLSDMTASVEDGELNESISHLADSFHSAAVEIADLVSDNLPDFIDGIAKTLDFVITFRKEIASAVKGFVAFKAAMAVESLVRGLTNAFKGLNATLAANPFLLVAGAIGVAVTAVSEFNAHVDDCNDRMRDLQTNAENMITKAEEYRQKTKSLSDVKERYDKIVTSADDAATKTANLKTLQDELISQYPNLKNQIDLVTGAYDEQAAALQRLAERDRETAVRLANTAVKKAELAQNEETFVKLDYLMTADGFGEKFGEKIKSMPTFNGGGFGNTYFSGTYEDRSRDFEALYDYVSAYEMTLDRTEPQYEGIVELMDTLESQAALMKDYNQKLKEARQQYNDLMNPSTYITPTTPDFSGVDDRGIPWSAYIDPNDRSKGFKKSTPGSTGSTSVTSTTGGTDAYKQDKQLADDMYSVGEISAKEYYQKLVALRDEYLTKGTHEWYQATAQIQSAYAKTADGIANAAKKSSDAVKDSLNEVKSAYKSTLDAIDAELEKHNRDKKDTEYQAKIDALSARLKYEQLDDFSRIALEKQLADVRDEWDEVKYQRNATNAKSMLNTIYTQAQSAVNYVPQGSINQWNSAISAAIEQIGGTAGNTKANNSANSAVYNIVVNAQNKTTDQIVREVTAAISKKAV